jgi:hypothetical protein
MHRFVILEHDHPMPHFDLMLEEGGRLRSWRLMGDPCSPFAIPAEPIGDHRIDYLDYEGPVSGGRGNVTRWDAGMYRVLVMAPGRFVVELVGVRCAGKGEMLDDGPTMTWRWIFGGRQFKDEPPRHEGTK